MDPQGTITLRDALVRHKPFIPCTARDTKNTKHGAWPTPSIRVWSEFSLQTLNDSYGHVLDAVLPQHLVDALISPAMLNGITVQNDDGPQRLIGWDDATVVPLVKWAKQYLGLHAGHALYHQFTHADGTVIARLPHAPRKLNIDHAIHLRNVEHDALVVGLGRTSRKWKSVSAMRASASRTMEALWPLRQLANLCRLAETRYGYIQTDEELVACCFSATYGDQGTGEKEWTDWTVAIMPVPWNTELSSGGGPHVLTTELALWWLCMLALSDGHRELVANELVVPIDAWETMHSGDERGWIRRHRYSLFEKLANVPPPPPSNAYTAPGTVNAAAFTGDAGFDEEEWFSLLDPATVGFVNGKDLDLSVLDNTNV
ncbi:hypothetical protein F503_00586 [Ophiostoma piceae UAMH 11346]|uniref:Uncharacterized protein n=1 Tax=Ophiostoma piceae (strain UAMH 11346) TaxID=1262450 RepID=S3C2V9_OPHP1|nr:hypothetical protein F503_00586 [Ophiostoma piceae UAMH 11346]